MNKNSKIHTTNYSNTFIEIAEDCPANHGEVPSQNGESMSVARMQFEIISKNPYHFISDDIIFQVFARRNDLTEPELEDARIALFSKGQACFRSSPLTKRYGFGIHFNEAGKVALVACETEDYEEFVQNPSIKKIKAMRNVRKKMAP